jgi:hypothetical protein
VCSSRETGPAVSRDGTNRTAQSVPSRVTCAQLAGQLLAWWMLRVLDCASGDARSNRSNGSRAVARRASPRSPQQARMVLAAGVGENAVVTSCSSQMQGPGLLASSGVARTTAVHIGCGAGAKRVVASRPVRTCQQTAAGAGASRAERSTAQHSTAQECCNAVFKQKTPSPRGPQRLSVGRQTRAQQFCGASCFGVSSVRRFLA